jgi:HAD superfamily hydrolase (TIGR01509 family)
LAGVPDIAAGTALPAALIFDLDGTIVDTETVEYEAIRAVWAAHGVDYAPTRYAEIIGTISGELWLEELEALVEQGVDRARSMATHRAVHTRLTDALQPRDGIIALIEEAVAADVPMAVASNSPRWWVQARVDALGLGSSLQVLVTLDDASAPKPDPAPFAEACAALGVEPSKSVAFEDSVTGVRSALAAGLYTVACAGPLSLGHDLSEAHRVITSHSEISLAELGQAVRGRSQPVRRIR